MIIKADELLNAMNVGVFAIDTDKKVVFANRVLRRMLFHENPEQVDLDTIQKVLRKSLLALNQEVLLDRAMFQHEIVSTHETILRDAEAVPIPVHIHIDLLLDPDEKVIGVIESIREITPALFVRGGSDPRPTGLRSLIGKSKKLLETLDLVGSAAASQVTVLLEGGSGTGKELIARAIHQTGPRRDKPFIAVNCASLSDDLLESELFGHMKGAFTGAIYDRPGRFELADQGTLFLDEIGDMSPAAQAKVLRVLQEHEFERVGGTKTVRVDVRIIAATNKNLSQEVSQGRFREDLYYRIRVFPIRVPLLRERKDDIFPLIKHFMAKFSRETGKQIINISPKALEYLLSYDYPGNVRELENMIEHAFVTSPGPTLLIEHLPASATFSLKEAPALLQTEGGVLAEQERTMVMKVLKETDWNQTKAAERLGISRSTLARRLKAFRIEYSKSAS
jgi:transcriptional regulator with GAF, ATPase, and Fis domain